MFTWVVFKYFVIFKFVIRSVLLLCGQKNFWKFHDLLYFPIFIKIFCWNYKYDLTILTSSLADNLFFLQYSNHSIKLLRVSVALKIIELWYIHGFHNLSKSFCIIFFHFDSSISKVDCRRLLRKDHSKKECML